MSGAHHIIISHYPGRGSSKTIFSSRHYFTAVAFIPLLAAASTLRPNHTGSVINTSSMSGITRTTQHHFMYNVSKAADIHLTKLLAQELRRKAVRVRVNR